MTDSARSDMDEIADGLALWQEHRPQTVEDWKEVARRFSEEVDGLREELRIARFDADVPVRELREENERLRVALRLIADNEHGSRADRNTARVVLDG